ncbi:MAG: prolyl oligopeptidase family serine peptidase [Ilumatobacter sp.]|uniref:prolyl oligopeptidase family serine peptidase n=3 Tax=Ilumatobacter sp. TaxID=1967498 RepID=UPI00329A09C6
MSDSFPRQYARTQRFTLGEPRNVTVSPDGKRIVFLRSSAGDDPVNALWVMDVDTGAERLVADPRALLGLDDPAGDDIRDEVTDEERARRERTRDGSTGITAYATDAKCQVAAFALNGALFAAGLLSGQARPIHVQGPVHDPRPDPTATRLAYVSGRTLRIGELDGSSRLLAGDDPKDSDAVSWGGADFIAAEEMHRFRGFWWSPDGQTIAACRVDDGPVSEWTIADPADPNRPARTVRYPAAGTDNPIVTLHLLGLDGSRRMVDWDREFFPYLAHVDWTEDGLLMSVQSRDQRGSMAMKVDLGTGEAIALTSDYDDAWIENVPGVPRLLPGGALLTASDRDGMRRLYVDDRPVTPNDLQVRSVAAVADFDDSDDPTIVFLANDPDEPTELHVWSTTPSTDPEADGSRPGRFTERVGVHSIAVGGTTCVVRSLVPDTPGATHTVLVDRVVDGPTITSHAQLPSIAPNLTLIKAGDRDIATAVLFPTGHDPDDDTKLPVLLDPYGGPHAQRVTASHNAHLSSQWFADQGFVVVVADGRGTPGRGAEWERAVRNDLMNPPLDDQIDALHDTATRFAAVDLDRVAIRGWSFGGYLAALAVLKRPDVFHAAIAGAPVTEWRLYDTHYTERYLGDPNGTGPEEGAVVYDANSLLPLAADLTRPLLLIHGLADDNVVAAHTLRLSSALLAAGRAHEVLPLVGVTHMTPQEVVAENILVHQLDFLSRSLGLDLEASGS